jgi:hypothetical protein
MPSPKRLLAIAQHEAAHVVVGVALGLRLGRASAAPWATKNGDEGDGYCWFPLPPGRRTWADAVTGAAGVAWERAVAPGDSDEEGAQRYDWSELLAAVPSRHDAETCVRAAAALLAGLGAAHARVTRALLDRDLGPDDIEAMVHGEARD